MLNNCRYPVVDITGLEYGYDGVPQSVRARTFAVRFSNTGAELHEILLLKITQNQSLQHVLHRGGDAVKENGLRSISSIYASPGESNVGFFEVTKPGRYVMACLIPQGTSSREQHGKGDPHIGLGMFAEFSVEPA
jgi:hypothetical protein